ncbi:hypothetical protein [Enterovirga rhinocerotis]|uniref:Uncharacterized protein n=1 Tax=Enterovirga rhinocerotis TaxID=1339210 RepID=A0A4R7C6L0_9HYPH|nr:hypothetical protein [Enterovirga rhinocerotis]TDR94214.1 hypothetical protein EV668_1494 [Enterovirga rhinocerotis]
MKPVANWRRVLRYAWSIRLNLLAALFGGAEVAIGFLAAEPPIPRGSFAAIAFVVSIGATVSRLIAQQTVSGDPQ